MATESDVTQTLRLLSAAYPTFQLRIETITVYVRLLADLEGQAITAAAVQHIAESRFFPTVAELRDMTLSLTRGEREDPAALEAWPLVLAEVRRGVGHPQVYKPTSLTDPLILRAVESIGGWRMLATSTNADDIAHRARFVEIYNRLAQRQRQAARLLPEVREQIEHVLAARDVHGQFNSPPRQLAEPVVDPRPEYRGLGLEAEQLAALESERQAAFADVFDQRPASGGRAA